MSIYEHVETFYKRPVVEFDPAKGIEDPRGKAYALRTEFDGADFAEILTPFLQDPNLDEVEALVIGNWSPEGTMEDDLEANLAPLLEAKDTLKNLEALFIGDVIQEESEISWIYVSGITKIINAFPKLRCLWLRAGEEFFLEPLQLPLLEELVIQSGGLSSDVVETLYTSELPALKHLELWLGTEDYGGDCTAATFNPLLSGKLYPRLSHLGLKNSEIQDEVAVAIMGAPILVQLCTLDMSMGTLGETGALAVLEGPVSHLESIDLSENYVPEDLFPRFASLSPTVLLGEQKNDEEYGERYCSVSE